MISGMKIAICGSMAFAREMLSAKKKLEETGHSVVNPPLIEEFIKTKKLRQRAQRGGGAEGAKLKKKHDLIRRYYEEIKNADAILVLNYNKNSIENYIGGNSFLEMGFAHVLRKKIYLLNPAPKSSFYYEEVLAMEPTVLKGDLSRVG